MTQKQFVKKVKEQLGRDDLQYWHIEHLVKSGIVNPVRKGSGRPREFSNDDVQKAIDYYSNI